MPGDASTAFRFPLTPARVRAHLRVRWKRFLDESSILRKYLWKYRKLAGIGVLCLAVVDTLEVIPPLLLKDAIDVAVAGGTTAQIAGFALTYLGVALVQGLGRYGWRMYLIRASLLSGRDIRQEYGRHLFTLSSTFFEKKRVGDLLSLATSDVDAIRMAMGAGILVLADSVILFITSAAMMLYLSPELALISFLPFPILPFIVARNEREIHVRFEKVQESFGELSAMAQENLSGIRVIKGFAREDARIRAFAAAGDEYSRLSMRLARVQNAFGPMLDFTMSLGIAILLYVGGKSVISDAISIGTFVAFHRYIQKMVWPMTAFGMAITHYQRAVASSGRINAVLETKPDVAEPERPAVFPIATGWKTPGRIELRDLTFRFPNGTEDVLRGVSLEIGAGERVAFVGSVGAGKSALLGLLPRLYPVAKGMVLVDGVDINDWPLEELRNQVGYVGQEVFLFNDSVAENLRFGLTELMPENSEVLTAMEIAAVREVDLGERGLSLSGGQKQRLTIARALAKKPAILVIDDALSAVDVRTEERILRALRERPGRNTEVVAAHRISTIRDADRIVVLDQGMIRQLGAHAELLRDRRGAYRRFYEQQRLKEDLEAFSEGGSHV